MSKKIIFPEHWRCQAIGWASKVIVRFRETVMAVVSLFSSTSLKSHSDMHMKQKPICCNQSLTSMSCVLVGGDQ